MHSASERCTPQATGHAYVYACPRMHDAPPTLASALRTDCTPQARCAPKGKKPTRGLAGCVARGRVQVIFRDVARHPRERISTFRYDRTVRKLYGFGKIQNFSYYRPLPTAKQQVGGRRHKTLQVRARSIPADVEPKAFEAHKRRTGLASSTHPTSPPPSSTYYSFLDFLPDIRRLLPTSLPLTRWLHSGAA